MKQQKTPPRIPVGAPFLQNGKAASCEDSGAELADSVVLNLHPVPGGQRVAGCSSAANVITPISELLFTTLPFTRIRIADLPSERQFTLAVRMARG